MSKRPPSLRKAATALEERRPFSFDRPLHAAIARLTGGLSPAALMQAHADWVQHLFFSPDKQAALVEKAVRK